MLVFKGISGSIQRSISIVNIKKEKCWGSRFYLHQIWIYYKKSLSRIGQNATFIKQRIIMFCILSVSFIRYFADNFYSLVNTATTTARLFYVVTVSTYLKRSWLSSTVAGEGGHHLRHLPLPLEAFAGS